MKTKGTRIAKSDKILTDWGYPNPFALASIIDKALVKAWNEGYRASQSGHDIKSNPYKKSNP